MSDAGMPVQKWLVSTTKSVAIRWLEKQIQERKSKIVTSKQSIEDWLNKEKKDLETQIEMNERELVYLEAKMTELQAKPEQVFIEDKTKETIEGIKEE